MIKYQQLGNTRVALLPTVTNLSLPTLAEIAAGVDISCDITADGLRLPRTEATIDATPWAGPVETERPTRVVMNAGLIGYRFLDPDDEVLWPAALIHERGVLVVRRGVPYVTPWTAGDVVETIDFEFGKRSPADPAPETMATFTVRLFVSDEVDDAVVTA